MDDFRLGLVGCAGTGKTTLAEKVAEKLSIPCLKAKDITGFILERDGYDYSSGVQVERFLSITGRQNEILRKTLEQQAVPKFVTDRTVVDLAAYAVAGLYDDPDAIKDIYETCRKNVGLYTHLFLCRRQDGPVKKNNVRTLNPWYQLMIHAVEWGLLNDWGCQFHVLNAKTADARADEICSCLS